MAPIRKVAAPLPEPPAVRHSREWLPNFIVALFVLGALLFAFEWIDGRDALLVLEAMKHPNLTPDERADMLAAYQAHIAHDESNDGYVNTAIGAIAVAISSLVKRNGDK